MDDKLYQEYINYIMSFSPNVSAKVKRDSTGKLIEVIIFFKTDSGRWRLTKSWDIFVASWKMHLKDVYQYSSLPKITQSTQEMDDIH